VPEVLLQRASRFLLLIKAVYNDNSICSALHRSWYSIGFPLDRTLYPD
jgi:hypothetical protein